LSSILKALKKIESSAPPEESLNRAQVFNPRAVFGQRQRGRRLASKTIWIGLAAVVVLAAGIFFQGWMSESTGPRGGKPLTAAADNAPAGTNAFHAKLPDVKAASPSPPVAAQPLPGQAASVVAPAPLPAAAPEAPAARKSAPPAAKPAARPLPKDKLPAPATERPSTLAQKAASPRKTAPLGRPPAARTPEDNLSLLDNFKLKVMAIAWYPDATRRIAVINGHIVKEGESVDGYTITQIRKDDVIVNDGSRSWRVEFTLKVQP
jgi:hypothetical protein